ncbi:MAG: GNAT family N-acetyltransferase [Chloroflexi bacterium]|nr:GNAT family N-acetyltransferase [Chloroflexota bacterium]
MINVKTLVRPADVRDQRKIANLMFFEAHVHRHLDWRTPLDWLGSPLYWVIEHNDQIVAALACPQDPPPIAWVRLFAHAGHFSSRDAWNMLWETAKAELGERGGATVAAITLHTWFQTLLQDSGFANRQQIIMMAWENRPVPQCARPRGVLLRPMTPDDLPQVADLDAAAFPPIWQNSLSALERAFPQAVVSTVAENEEGRLVGYQISTQSPFGAHLARLAVQPDAQQRGIGSALVCDLTAQLVHRGIQRLTVNTQSDNFASLALYKKNGFQTTGEQYPVYVYEVPADG